MSIILKLNNVTKELENKVKTQKISNVRRKIKGSFKTLFMFINNKYIECIDLLYKNSGSSKSKNQLKNMISKQKDVTAIQNRKILNALNYFKVKIEVLNNRKNSRLLCDNSKLINKINSTFFILSNFLNKNNLMYIYRLKIFYNIRKIMYSYKVCTLKYQLDVQRETRSKDMDKEMIKEQEKIKQISLMTSIERKLYELSLNTCNRNINFYKSNVLAYSKFLVIKRKRTVENFFNVLQHHILEKIFLYLNIKRKTDKLNQRICESLFLILNLYTRRLELSTSKKLNFSSTEVKMYDDTLFKKEYLNFKILRSFLSLKKVIQYLKERFNNEISESFIFILSKGSLENDKRFIKLVDSTLRDIEKYDDPVVIRMGIQFILAKKYIGDIIFLKEQAELKENMIFEYFYYPWKMIFTGKNGSIMISKSFLYLITKTSIFKCENDLIIDTCAISGSFFVKRFGEEWFIALEHKIYKINDVDKFYDFLKSMENKLDHSLIAVFLFSSVPEVDDYTLIDYHIYKDIVYFIFKDGKRYIIYKNNEEFFIFPKLIFRFYKKHLFIVEDSELKKIYLKDKKKEVLRSNVYFNYLFINDELILGSCKNGSISIYKDKDVISFHKHAASLKEVLFIDDILYIITEDQKFSIVELKRNSRYDVFSFYGVFKKMYLYSNFILILTELELIKYNLRSGSIESWNFCIPKATNIKYCKEDCDEIYEDVLNEYKIKNFKAEVEAIYQRLDEDMYQVSNYKFSKKVKTDVNKITLVSRYKSFIFLYDSCIKYIFSIPKKELYYSNGFLLSLKSKKNKKITIDIYKILDNKLLYVTHRDTKLHKKPEEIYYINSTLFFLVDGRLYKNCIFITNLCILNNIKIIKECYKGIYALNNKGIYDLQINSYVKKSKNLSDFQFFKDDLYYLKDNTKLYCNGDLFLDDIGGHSFYINSKRIFIVASKDNHSEMSVYKNKVKKDSIHLNCDAEFCIRSDVIKTKDNLLYFIE